MVAPRPVRLPLDGPPLLGQFTLAASSGDAPGVLAGSVLPAVEDVSPHPTAAAGSPRIASPTNRLANMRPTIAR